MARKKEKVHLLTDSDLRRRDAKQFKDISHFAIYMFLAWLKDTGYIGNDRDILLAEYNRLDSWFTAWEQHLISIEDVQEIIERDTGMYPRVVNDEQF